MIDRPTGNSMPPEARVRLSEIPVRNFTHYETGVAPNGVGEPEYVRDVQDACNRKSAANLGLSPTLDHDIMCATCVYTSRMPGIYLYPDGRCNMCHAFEEAKANASGLLIRELEEALAPSSSPDAEFDLVVALSGGKDSSAALSYVAQEQGLRVVSVLVDNAFIPDYVVENCRAMCKTAGAEFVLLNFDFRADVKKAIKEEHPSFYPCNLCSKRFKNLIAEYSVKIGCPRIIMGRNYWATIEPELSGVREMRANDDASVRFYSLPFLLGWNLADLEPRLQRVGWSQRNKDIPGLSTNCRVPGIVENSYLQRTGLHPEAPLLANEVICGFISREEALADLQHD